MSRFVIILLFFAQFAEISFAARRVTIAQLNQIVTSAQGKRDGKIAERLLGLELSERLSAAKLAAMQSALPGPESRQALTIIAGIAEFQEPPGAEVPTQPAPTLEEQRDIAARAIDHINATIHRLPPLFVARSTDHYEDTPPDLQTIGTESKSGVFSPPQLLHLTGRVTENITYRYGDVLIVKGANERVASSTESAGVGLTGEFGQVLSTIFSDMSKGKLAWSHWEEAGGKNVGVFQFTVPSEASHYQLQYCCVDGEAVEKFVAYHGVIAIDPTDGAIVRLAIVTDPHKSDAIAKADLMIEYESVELGGQRFTCPSRSVAVSIVRVQPAHQTVLPAIGSSVSRGNVVMVDRDNSAAMPQQTMVNTVAYDHYSLNRPD